MDRTESDVIQNLITLYHNRQLYTIISEALAELHNISIITNKIVSILLLWMYNDKFIFWPIWF